MYLKDFFCGVFFVCAWVVFCCCCLFFDGIAYNKTHRNFWAKQTAGILSCNIE